MTHLVVISEDFRRPVAFIEPGVYSSGFLTGPNRGATGPYTSERVARVCRLHYLFYVLDSREASFQLV